MEKERQTFMVLRNGKLPTELSTVMETVKVLAKFNTAELCIVSQAPTLGLIRRENSEQYVLDYITMWLISINEKLNIKRPMPPATLEETAFHILNDYPYFNIADINLVFSRAVKGEFGEMYESLSMAKVLGWFGDYAEERMEKGEEMSMAEHDRYKSDKRVPTIQQELQRLSGVNFAKNGRGGYGGKK